jgi:ribosome-binding protein aMBF1 (putative translation factor)
MFQPEAPIRDVLICPWCKLRQFSGKNNTCRRCRKPLSITYLEIPFSPMTTDPYSLAVTVGRTIRELRLRRGYSQLTLASRIRSHRTHVSRIERGMVTPTLPMLLRAALALGIEKLFIRLRD